MVAVLVPVFYCDRYLLEGLYKKEGLILATEAETVAWCRRLWAGMKENTQL